MAKVLLWIGCLAVAFLAIAFAAERFLASRAVWAQRVMPPKAEVEALFGDEPSPIGSPQLYVVFDGRAFLPTKSDSGVLQLDESYLQRTGTYPLQLKTVEFVGSLVRWSAATVAFLALVGRWLLLRRARGGVAHGSLGGS